MASLKYWRVLAISLFLILALLGCNQKQSPQELQEKTAEATAQAKSNAKAVAEGIREGWNRNNKTVDLNTATRDQLLALPGMSAAESDRVIAGRPYSQPDDLVKRRIMSKAEFDKIADQVTAK